MLRFLHKARPVLIAFAVAILLAEIIFLILFFTKQISFGTFRINPLPTLILFFLGMAALNACNFISKTSFVDERSPYRLWERGAECVGVVSIPMSAAEVHSAMKEVLQENGKLRIHAEHPDWIWVSLSKTADRVGYWMGAYFSTDAAGTTLTLGIWTKTFRGYDYGRSRRRITRLLNSLTSKIAPAEMIPLTYQPSAPVPVSHFAQQPTEQKI